jgi:hypothetical protein
MLEDEVTVLLRPEHATLKWPDFVMEYGDAGWRVSVVRFSVLDQFPVTCCMLIQKDT